MGFNEQIIDEFRANNGTVTAMGFGRGLILVHHVGARSGVERVAPLAGIHVDGSWLIAASKGGTPENPAWYYNLLANPDTVIETPDDGEVAVHVTELVGDDRDAAWVRFTERSAGFKAYEEKTARVIPVLQLSPR